MSGGVPMPAVLKRLSQRILRTSTCYFARKMNNAAQVDTSIVMGLLCCVWGTTTVQNCSSILAAHKINYSKNVSSFCNVHLKESGQPKLKCLWHEARQAKVEKMTDKKIAVASENVRRVLGQKTALQNYHPLKDETVLSNKRCWARFA